MFEGKPQFSIREIENQKRKVFSTTIIISGILLFTIIFSYVGGKLSKYDAFANTTLEYSINQEGITGEIMNNYDESLFAVTVAVEGTMRGEKVSDVFLLDIGTEDAIEPGKGYTFQIDLSKEATVEDVYIMRIN